MKYMTAREEDILTSQNLIQKGVVIDKLLESLIVDDFNYNDLLMGDKNALMIAGEQVDEGFGRAASSLPFIDVLPQQGANVYDMLRRDVLVLSRDAAAYLEERLK